MVTEKKIALLNCQGVTYCYEDGFHALSGIDFYAEKGEFVALLASNGSGKTTLLKVLAGLLPVQKGCVSIDGQDIRKMRSLELYSRIGILMQNPKDQLFGATVFEDVAFGPRNQGLSDANVCLCVQEALELVGVSDFVNRAIHHLSFGEQKRVALAGLLAMKPTILLLDEVTAGLDPVGETHIVQILKRLSHEQKMTVVFATHSVDLLPLIADRIYVLNRGRVITCETPEKLFDDQEKLKQVGLRLPYISSLFHALRAHDGLPIRELPLTVQAAREEVLAWLPDDVWQKNK
ncbi:MAG: ATP-binding cassette domain-containing protein [bacterium]